MDTELAKGSEKAVEGSEKAEKGSSKRVVSNLEQEDAKRQKIEEENESAELKRCMEVILEDDDDKYQQGTNKVLNWKLFDSCRVYCVTTENMVYYLMVEKMYPFTRNFLHQIWNDVRLQVEYEVEMAYDLLRLTRRQINEGYVPE
uniref:Uncharacterized protein n=1 Tax=Tanacetum cinerariifolium TaxID=118510 RepID=A0A6L2NAE1_TANCI|nr:hypothetical protein [Tanacetum cinerariifolium]